MMMRFSPIQTERRYNKMSPKYYFVTEIAVMFSVHLYYLKAWQGVESKKLRMFI